MVAFYRLQGGFVSPMRAALYARVSTHDQHTLAMQLDAMREFATRRHWTVIDAVEEIASGAKDSRPRRQALLKAAKQRKLDVILVWKLDRWRRSLVDLMTTLHELTALDVGFVSLTEALDLTTPAGRAFAGFLAVFAEFERDLIRERIKDGITDARRRGKPHGRPRAQANDADQIRVLAQQGFSQAAIARHLRIWRTSVRRALTQLERRYKEREESVAQCITVCHVVSVHVCDTTFSFPALERTYKRTSLRPRKCFPER